VAAIDDIRRLVALDHGLASVSTLRDDGSIQSTVVNAGVVDHPLSGAPVAAFVGRPATHKIAHLRRNPTATLLWRAGWAWVAAEGTVDLFGPDDPLDGVADSRLPGLLREAYAAAGGGQHEDWAEYDRVVAAERRMAVLLTPSRIYVNP
jgi:PPOX class probable F420-dependent enzyme